MTVSAIASSTAVGSSTTAQNAQSAYQQGGVDFKSLLQALQSGDLSGAQQAYSALQQDIQGISSGLVTDQSSITGASGTTSANGTASTPAPASPLSADFQTLGQALQSGDLTGAQNALSQLEQDAQQIGGVHHHHHHHHHYSTGAPSASTGTSATTSVPSTGMTVPAGGTINTTA